MYIYVVELPYDFTFETPKKVSEGILDWKSISWILSDYNYGVGEMLPKLLPEVLHNDLILEYNFVLSNHKLIDYRNEELIKQDTSINFIHNADQL
mgnify:CR=1 FL=1